MYCSICKMYGEGKFCANCGSRMAEGGPDPGEGPENGNAPVPDGVRTAGSLENGGMPPFLSNTIPSRAFMPMEQINPDAINLSKVWSGPNAINGTIPQPEGFRIEYSTSEMMFNGGFTLKAWEEDGKYKALYRTPGVDIRNAPVFDVDNSFIEQIKILMNVSNCESWNGFSGCMQGVMDGTSYSFSYSDGEGKHVSWGGYMARPDGFGAAGGVLKAMFDEIYDERYPNYYKRMAKYLDDVVKQKYGLSRQGYSKAFYRNKDENYYERHGWTAPVGCLYATIDNFCDRIVKKAGSTSDGDDSGVNPGMEAFTVFIDPDPEEVQKKAENGQESAEPGQENAEHGNIMKDPYNVPYASGLTFRWYKVDKDGVELTGEVTPAPFVPAADAGYTQVFSYRAGDTTYFGFYSRTFKSFGKDCIDYTLLLYSFRDGKWQWLDGIHSVSDINDINREDLDAFIRFARKYGMDEVADKWDESGKLSMSLIDYNVMVWFKWDTNVDKNFHNTVIQTPFGEYVPGYEIEVETVVYRNYFRM